MANNIAVSITADVADLQVKRAIMSAELKAATKDLNAFAKEAASTGSTDALREGMLASAAAAEKAKAGIAQVNAEIKSMSASVAPAVEQMEHGFEGISVSAREMGLQVRESFAAVGEMREVMLGFGEAMLAAFAVERVAEWGKEMGEAAENVKHLADEFGFSLAQVEKLQGVALGAGVGVDTVARGMALLDKNAATASGKATAVGKALAIVGVSANDGRSQMERLATVADKFQSLSAGPERLALSMALFGKNGREMIPVLELGSKGIEELAAKAEELGMVNENATEKGIKLAEVINTNKIAWEGLKTTLEDAFAETLTQIAEAFDNLIKGMVESYRNGGAVRQIFDAIRVTAGLLGDTLAIVGDVIKTLYENLNTIIPIAGAFASVLVGRYVVGAAAAILSTTELRLAMIGLIGIFEAGGVVEAFTALLAGLAATLRGVAAATLEASAALLASPWTWVAGVVAVAIAMYRDYNAATVEQITATNDLAKAKDTLANTEENLTGKSKDALEAMKAETGVALDLARAHLKTAEAALAAANAEAAVASQRADSFNPSVSSGGGAGLLTATAVGAALAQKQADKAREAYDTQKKAVDDLTESIAKLDKAIASVPDAPKIDLSDGGHQSKKKDDLVQRLQDELDAKKLAWNLENDAHGTAIAFDLEIERKYWADILAGTELSDKQRGEVSRKFDAVEQQINKEKISLQVDNYKKLLDEAKGNTAARLELAKQEADYIRRMLGEKSSEYIAAERQIDNIVRESADEQRRIADELATHTAKLRQIEITEEEAAAKFRVAMGVETNAQLLQDQMKFETRSWNETNKRYTAEIAAAQHGSIEERKLLDQQGEARKNYEAKITALTRQAVLQRTAIERQGITSTANLWGQNIAKLVTLQQGFATTLHNLYTGMVSIVSDALAQILESWLVKHISTLLLGTAASKASGAAEISTAAAIAGANGVASMAGAPWPMDMTAPAFGAAMALQAGLYGTALAVPSGKGGMLETKEGLMMVHEQEMLLPSGIASAFRNMLGAFSGYGVPQSISGGFRGYGSPSSYSAPSQPAAAQGGGPIILNFHGPTNKREIEKWISDHSGGVVQGMRKAYRNLAPMPK